jgi:serine/threonine protein kinase
MNESSPPPPSQDLTGRVLGDYRVLRRLGAGGMADVYLAEQQSLGRQVALKILREQLADDANYVERFAHEARAAASLVHPNIVQIYEVGREQNVHFIAQEYVAGKNLGQVVERQGALQPGLVLDILRQVVSALCKSHELGIVHRDIKPENILLSHAGEVKVADFGLARVTGTDTKTLTQVGVTMGTPLYMSPEQIEGRPLDVRSDIYSLGVTCYFLLTGVTPHSGETALAVAVQHLNSTPTPLENVRPELSSVLARTVHQMLAKKPENRPASPSELLVALRDLAKTAATEGWAEGPDNWTLAEWIATDETRSQASSQLSELMKAETKLRLASRRWGRLALGLLAAVLGGVLLASFLRPSPYFADTHSPLVPRRSSAEAQLYLAKISDSPAAWQSVWQEFPDADPFVHRLAKQGLVRYYLLVSQHYGQAISIIDELEQLSVSNESLESLESIRAFAFASECICNERLGRIEDAKTARDQLTPDRRDLLRRGEAQIHELLQVSLSNLDE